MFNIRTSHLFVPLGPIAPMDSTAANYCIAVGGGLGNGGTSFIAEGFTVPAAGNCTPWSGFLKTGRIVVATSTGVRCLSSDGKVLQLSVVSTDPSFFGSSLSTTDQIRLCPAGVTDCPMSGQIKPATAPGGPMPAAPSLTFCNGRAVGQAW
jgi:hypothetical protein